ncbi:MAG: hypothetical protein MK078_05580 [Crocinitomicaceae bacterium]|nr:hypothetical protein [Crocinitomicaceae bacterium]
MKSLSIFICFSTFLVSCSKKEEINNKTGTYIGNQTITYGLVPNDTVVNISLVEYFISYNNSEKEYYFFSDDWSYAYEIKYDEFTDDKHTFSWGDHDRESYSISIYNNGQMSYGYTRTSDIDQANLRLEFFGQKK